ncbi:type II toxin-antitoxin system RelE/ParE family toxin [Pedobacter alpinus]|uniref:Type II toxin-antitoxin system RelE/ParE family toxin n=1 Tax=Pedobacter alpinus TaxID=1590643 RepID=A0ABW5TT67_9SPHI
MTNEVIWSPESEIDLSIILDYLISDWNLEIATKFLKEIEYHINTISKNPKLYPIIYKPLKFRQCVITKHNSLIYFYKEEKLYVVRVFDTRQNPNKLKFNRK